MLLYVGSLHAAAHCDSAVAVAVNVAAVSRMRCRIGKSFQAEVVNVMQRLLLLLLQRLLLLLL